MAICPPEPVPLADGGGYIPNGIQLAIWGYWQDFWHRWAPLATRGEPYDLVLNGDLVEGRHHSAVHQISLNLADHYRIAKQVLEPIVKLVKENGGRLFVIRGTEAHGGASSENEEVLARELGAMPNAAGQYARYDLYLRVGRALCHFSHHIGTSGVSHYETSAIQREMVEAFNEASRWSDEPPDVTIRSHRHRYAKTEIAGSKNGKNRLFISAVTPGWQAKTPFAYRVAGGRMAPPQFGGLCIREGDEEAYVRPCVYSIQRSETE